MWCENGFAALRGDSATSPYLHQVLYNSDLCKRRREKDPQEMHRGAWNKAFIQVQRSARNILQASNRLAIVGHVIVSS